MTSAVIIALAVLVAIFVIATIFEINIGILGFIGAFGVGTLVLQQSEKQILEHFPASIVLTIVGVTYFFAVARRNGTVEVIVARLLSWFGHRTALLPWAFFLTAAGLTSIGTFSPAAVALLAPAAMPAARRAGINPLVMGVLIINGAHAGGFSPLSVSGVLVGNLAVKQGLQFSALFLFAASFVANLVISMIVVLVDLLVRRRRVVEQVSTRTPATATTGGSSRAGSVATLEGPADSGNAHTDDAPAVAPRANRIQKFTLLVLAVMVVSVVALNAPIGFVALAAGALLGGFDLSNQRACIADISWSTVLLVAGMMTYIALLESEGIIGQLSNAALSVGSPALVALLLCAVMAITSAFASSTALLTALVPLAAPLLATGGVSSMGMISALSVSATVVDVSPFSTNGALIIASADTALRQKLYRQLLGYAALVVIFAPIALWAVLV
ncbi:SLC13 family permease [Enemella evansiae]|uniref:C4-dicarboxylate ABC transporter n=1 Tax=Enemella evansiae TaxID=2016499 RepID=A0A255GKS8_9ACTN|nr:SLC13 family permease [Enemella evansiae]OYO13949.1 C4-dicarboxylate ABC transporter [Enemella evansiae]OYO16181.1 C4-dicarboxylate ABC transporter [Enemella evansiae]OYO18535.1 C4-dicarboxylate ABC transporter [Enemella evansiae]TDO84783.1 UIT1 family transporter [Enemella evansiae]